MAPTAVNSVAPEAEVDDAAQRANGLDKPAAVAGLEKGVPGEDVDWDDNDDGEDEAAGEGAAGGGQLST